MIYLEVRCSTQGCPGEEMAGEERVRVNLCFQLMHAVWSTCAHTIAASQAYLN